MRSTFCKSVLTAALLLGMSGAALAGTDTSNLAVSATVTASCTIDASAGLAFGNYDPVVTNRTDNLDETGTISTTCTNGSTAVVTLNQGANPGADSSDAQPARRMVAGTTNFLSYSLYTNEDHSTVWDNVNGNPVTGDGTAVSTTVYGSIPAGQNVAAATYNDTVLATITF